MILKTLRHGLLWEVRLKIQKNGALETKYLSNFSRSYYDLRFKSKEMDDDSPVECLTLNYLSVQMVARKYNISKTYQKVSLNIKVEKNQPFKYPLDHINTRKELPQDCSLHQHKRGWGHP